MADRFYYCNEDDKVYTLSEIMADYPLFKNEYQSEADYLSACMWYNNGALYSLRDHMKHLQYKIDRCTMVGQKYGYELVDEEMEQLRQELSELKRLYDEV